MPELFNQEEVDEQIDRLSHRAMLLGVGFEPTLFVEHVGRYGLYATVRNVDDILDRCRNLKFAGVIK